MRILVVGGGIAGLSAAWELERRGAAVTLVESRDRLGGNIHTITDGPYRVEAGPHSFLGSAESIFRLARELGIEDRLRPAAPSAALRYIFHDGQLKALPTGPLSFLSTPLLSAKTKWRFLTEPFRKMHHPPETSVADWMRAHFGPDFVDHFIAPFVSGIYAGDAERLCMSAAFPKFYGFEQATGSMIGGALRYMRAQQRLRGESADPLPRRKGTWTFDEGMDVLVSALEKQLKARIYTGTALRSLRREADGWHAALEGEQERFDGVVMATRAFEAADYLRPANPRLANALQQAVYAPVVVTHLAVKKSNLKRPLDGFGFLVPPSQQRPILGVIWVSSIFAGRCPDDEALVAVFAGGINHPEKLKWDDRKLKSRVLEELNATILKEPRADWVKFLRYPTAIPQYTNAHREVQAQVHAAMEADPALAIVGNYVGGVSAGDTVAWARAATARLAGRIESR